jgi:hypothetical protein
VLRFRLSFKPQDHVAIFALTTDLLLLRGFTEDTAALSHSVDRFSPRLLAAFDCREIQQAGISHFFKWEEQIGARLNSHRPDRDFRDFAATDQRPVLLLAKYFLPALVRRPLVTALPIDIFLIRETLTKIA